MIIIVTCEQHICFFLYILLMHDEHIIYIVFLFVNFNCMDFWIYIYTHVLLSENLIFVDWTSIWLFNYFPSKYIWKEKLHSKICNLYYLYDNNFVLNYGSEYSLFTCFSSVDVVTFHTKDIVLAMISYLLNWRTEYSNLIILQVRVVRIKW